MSLIKALILSNVLDPTVGLRELLDAFRVIDAVDGDELEKWEVERPEQVDAFIRRLTALF